MRRYALVSRAPQGQPRWRPAESGRGRPATLAKMRITLKLFASLTEYLPAEAVGHEVEVEVAEDATPSAVLDQFGIPRTLVHLVMVDGVYIAPEDRATRKLEAGCQLAMFPAIAGG